MEKKPLVSILLLSMNHERYIQKAVDSFVNQTYKNIEVIFLDNASHDQTFEKGKKLLEESQLPFKAFKNKESKGISKNFNFLLQESSGEYISAISADDWLSIDNIQLKLNYFFAHPEFGMIYNDFRYFNYDTGKYLPGRKKKNFKEGWVLKDILGNNFIVTVGNMIKRTTFESVGTWDEESPIEDWEMWIRIAEKFPIGCIRKELAFYGIKSGMNIIGDIKYMENGIDYILNKYSHYKEIKKASRFKATLMSYHYATKSPSWKTLKFIIKNCRFNFFYFKQIIKTILGIFKKKFQIWEEHVKKGTKITSYEKI